MRLFHKIATIYMHPMRITQKYLISQPGHHLPKNRCSQAYTGREVLWIQNDHSVTSSWCCQNFRHANLACREAGSYGFAEACSLELTAWEYGHVMQCNAEFVRRVGGHVDVPSHTKPISLPTLGTNYKVLSSPQAILRKTVQGPCS